MAKFIISLSMIVEVGVDFYVDAESIEHAKAKVMVEAKRDPGLIECHIRALEKPDKGIRVSGTSASVTGLALEQAVCGDCYKDHHGFCGEKQCNICKGEGMNEIGRAHV